MNVRKALYRPIGQQLVSLLADRLMISGTLLRHMTCLKPPAQPRIDPVDLFERKVLQGRMVAGATAALGGGKLVPDEPWRIVAKLLLIEWYAHPVCLLEVVGAETLSENGAAAERGSPRW